MHPAKRKGDTAERQAAELISRLLQFTVRRRLGAGRTTAAGGDLGDLDGVPDHAIQVASWADVAAAARLKPKEAAQQAAVIASANGKIEVTLYEIAGLCLWLI